MTLLFTRSDRLVCFSASIRPFSPCYPTQAVAGPIVSHIRNPDLAFSGGIHNFHGCLYPGLGRSTVVSTLATTVCGPPSILSVPSRPTVTTGVCFEWQVMEALMQHYKAAGFSREVPRLAAAPRRPSTNRMYEDRWLYSWPVTSDYQRIQVLFSLSP